MIKSCSESIPATLKIIFEQLLKEGKFPEIGKKAYVVLVHEKEDKSLVKKYRAINLLPNFGEVFERLIYNSIFNYYISKQTFYSLPIRFSSKRRMYCRTTINNT